MQIVLIVPCLGLLRGKVEKDESGRQGVFSAVFISHTCFFFSVLGFVARKGEKGKAIEDVENLLMFS